MSRSERGQALVEAVAIIPLCIMCSLALVDCGVVLRDRVAVAQAATRAAEAQLAGDPDVADAARGALPSKLRRSARITVRGDVVSVRVHSQLTVLDLVTPITHTSSATLADTGTVPA